MRDIKVADLRNFQQGMDDGRERRGRRAAEAYDAAGDYENAARAVRSFDPQAADGYERVGDRATARRETEAARAYDVAVTPQVAAGDFDGARRTAVQHGRGMVDIERLTVMAKNARQEELEQARAFNLKQAQALAQIEALPQEQRVQAYAAWRATLGERGGRMPEAYSPLAMKQILATTMSLEQIYDAEMKRRTDVSPEETQRLGLQGVYQRDGDNRLHMVQAGDTWRTLTPEEAAAQSLPAGAYRVNERTNKVEPIARETGGGGAGGGGRGVRPNLTPEALDEVKNARAALGGVRTLRGEATRWLELNAGRGTGGYGERTAGLNAPIFDDAGRQEMRAITARVTPMMRQAGSGTMSDKDVELFQRGTLSIANTGPVNQVIAHAMIEAAKNAEGYVEFLEDFAQRSGGSTLGAAAEWNQYLNAYPIFAEGGRGVNRNRPHWRDVLGGGATPEHTPPAHGGGQREPVLVRSQSEYDALPSGTPVIDAKGRRGVKP